MPDLQKRLRGNLWKLRAIRVFFWMFFFSSVIIPFFTQWGGLKLSQVFLLNAWFMFWNFAFEVPTGTIADRFGRKTSLILGSLVSGCAAWVYASRPDFRIFLIAEVLFAVAFTLHSGADEALAYDSLKAIGREGTSKKALASMQSFKLAGIIMATIAGGWIAAKFGLEAPMRWYVGPAAVSALLALTLTEAPHHADDAPKSRYLSLLKEGGRYFLGHKVLVLLAVEFALTNAVAWALIWLFQPALEHAGLAVKYYGLVHAASCTGQILVLSKIERLEILLGSKRRFLVLSAAVASAGFFALAALARWSGPSFWPLVATMAAVVLCFAFGLSRAPAFSAYMNKYIPSEKRATVLSFVSMCRTLGIVILSPAVGSLADRSLALTFFSLGATLAAVTWFSRIEESHLKD